MRSVLTLALALAALRPVGAQEVRSPQDDTTSIDGRSLRTAAILTGVYCVVGAAVMERTWYSDQKIVPFHFFNDNSGYLQVDKLGHAFGAYVESYVGYHWLLSSGVSKRNALLFGGGLGVILQTPIEFMDGIHEGWGFSWGDMAANALGSSLVVAQELALGEQIVRYKFSYWESRYAHMANGYLGEGFLDRMLEDYNGHTYWLTLPLRRLTGERRLPPWLNVAVGNGANGMFGEFENIAAYRGVEIPETRRYRQYLLSLDVDWTRLETTSRPMRVLLRVLNFVKMPFPALEMSSTGRLRGHWLYF